MSAPGWFKQRRPLIGKNTEAAPNSYTGSGQRVFPHGDGIVSFSLQRAFGNNAPQKPLRATCRPSKTASSISEEGRAFCRERSPRNRDRGKLVIGNQRRIGSVRCRLGTWAASAISSHAKPRSTARRPIQEYEVEPLAPVSHQGIGVPDQDPFVVLALLRLSSASSSPCRAEVGSTGVHDRHLPASYVNVRSVFFLSRRRSVWRRRPVACARGDTPCGRSSPPAPRGLSSCHACAPGVASISWPRAWRAASGKRLRRRPT
jgi:hypothetical protein